MSNSSSAASGGGMGLAGWTFIVFLVLKLTHVIDWSWWWVTAPLWGGLAVFVAIMLVGLFVAVLVKSLTRRR